MQLIQLVLFSFWQKGKKGKKSKGKVKANIPFPIYYEAERPPTAGVADGAIEKEQVKGSRDVGGRGGRLGEEEGGGQPFSSQEACAYVLLHLFYYYFCLQKQLSFVVHPCDVSMRAL